jgi:hypothetical protein
MAGYTLRLESRIAQLPKEMQEGLDPPRMAKLLGESLRQCFQQCFEGDDFQEYREAGLRLTKVLAPRATGSRTIPGVNNIKTTVLEVCNIARGELGLSHLCNSRDLRIRVADRSAERAAVNGNLRKDSRCVALEREDVARQILGKHGFRRCQQPVTTLAFGEQLNSIKDFCLGN